MHYSVPDDPNHFIVDRSFLPLDYPISDTTFRVYAALVRVVNDRGIYFGTLEDLGKLCPRRSGKPMHKTQIFRAVSELRFYKLMTDDNSALTLRQQEPHETHENEDIPKVLKASVEVDAVDSASTESAFAGENHIISTIDETNRLNNDPAFTHSQQERRFYAGFDVGHGESQTVVVNTESDLFVPRRGIFNRKDNIKLTTTSVSGLPETGGPDEFTRKHFPNAPVSVHYCEMYFQSHRERFELEYDCRAAALDFMEHWEHTKAWLYQRKKDTYPTRITEERVKSHLTTWGKGIRKGWKVYPIGDVDNEEKPDFVSPKYSWGQVENVSHRLNISAGDPNFWKQIDPSDPKSQWLMIAEPPREHVHIDTVV